MFALGCLFVYVQWFMVVLSFQVAAMLIEMNFGTEVQWQLSLLTSYICTLDSSFGDIIIYHEVVY